MSLDDKEGFRHLVKKLLDCDDSKLVTCLTNATTFATTNICMGSKTANNFARWFIDLTKNMRLDGRYRMFVLFITLISEIESNHKKSISTFTRAFGPRIFRLVQLVVPLRKANERERKKIRDFLLCLQAKKIFLRAHVENALKHVESCKFLTDEEENRQSSNTREEEDMLSQEKRMRLIIESVRLEQKKERIRKSLLSVEEIRAVGQCVGIEDRNLEFERFWKRNYKPVIRQPLHDRLQKFNQWRLPLVVPLKRRRSWRCVKQSPKSSPRLKLNPRLAKRMKQTDSNCIKKQSAVTSRSTVLPSSISIGDNSTLARVHEHNPGNHNLPPKQNKRDLASAFLSTGDQESACGSVESVPSPKRCRLIQGGVSYGHAQHSNKGVSNSMHLAPSQLHELPVGRPPPTLSSYASSDGGGSRRPSHDDTRVNSTYNLGARPPLGMRKPIHSHPQQTPVLEEKVPLTEGVPPFNVQNNGPIPWGQHAEMWDTRMNPVYNVPQFPQYPAQVMNTEFQQFNNPLGMHMPWQGASGSENHFLQQPFHGIPPNSHHHQQVQYPIGSNYGDRYYPHYNNQQAYTNLHPSFGAPQQFSSQQGHSLYNTQSYNR